MTDNDWNSPIRFQPLYMERIWGGHRLETEFGRKLPPGHRIGEAWEIADRPEAQSVVRDGLLRGVPLHDLWKNHRSEVFGDVPESARFPLLIKLLDAREKLSLQVHPPSQIAPSLGGEPKTEFWYIAKADAGALIYAGLREAMSPAQFEESIANGTIQEHIHEISVSEGDAIFLPAGRFHAIGAGNLIVEIQQNSDTTYRVYDWDRLDESGKPRELHIKKALQSIDFEDLEPEMVRPNGDSLVKNDLFEIQRWDLNASSRELSPAGGFVIVCALTGKVNCAGAELVPGDFCLVPASATNRSVSGLGGAASILRITIPH